MKRVFLFSFLAGFGLSIALAALYPLPDHVRFPSVIEVLTNGGRQEQFVIRWPQDRLALAGDSRLLEPAAQSSAFTLAGGESGALTELFRLRDVSGNVIGIATRTTGAGAAPGTGTTSDWVLMIPSRGFLIMSGRDSADLGPVRTGSGWKLPADTRGFWTAGSRYRITAGPLVGGRGRIVRGTDEFARLTGSYAETWELEEISADDGTEGRILLSTVMEATR